MKITVGRPEQPVFHPVTIVFETREDLALLVAAVGQSSTFQATARTAWHRLFGIVPISDSERQRLMDRLGQTYWRLERAYDQAVQS